MKMRLNFIQIMTKKIIFTVRKKRKNQKEEKIKRKMKKKTNHIQ